MPAGLSASCGSWAARATGLKRRGSAGALVESSLPGELWRNQAFLPYLALLLPYRLTSTTGKALDYAVQGHDANALVTIALDVSAPGETTGVNRKTDETKSE